MKAITTVSACVFLALAGPAFAQSNEGSSDNAQTQGTLNSMSNSKMKQPGSTDTQSGQAPKEGRSSSADPAQSGTSGGANDPARGNMSPGGGPGESGSK